MAQWVGYFLLFQALCFYMPRLAWKTLEAGKLRNLLCEDLATLVPSTKSRQCLADYIFINLNQHRTYVASFIGCEILTLANVIGQIFFIDVFLGGEFTAYGINVVQQSGMTDPDDRIDPMSKVN